ncbi:hypothetical protein [Paracraurococcus ruber]|nr:hypothetical protein [Paracraurococcus ruber]
MSRRTQALRPDIALEPKEAAKARAFRRQGMAPGEIAQRFNVPVEEVEKALVQMRSPRPESTRGTLNVTLAAHRFVLAERQGEEPLWQTMDRLLDELIRLRQGASRQGAAKPAPAARKPRDAARADELLPGLLPEAPH